MSTSLDPLERKRREFVPGQPDMWMFVLFETLLFTGYFSVYLVTRTQNEELFLRAQGDLDLRFGVFNTITLLLGSWAIARCVQASRAGAYRSALRHAFLAIGFGFASKYADAPAGGFQSLCWASWSQAKQ